MAMEITESLLRGETPSVHGDEATKTPNLNVFSRMSVKSGKLKSGASRERPPRQNGVSGPALSSMLASGAAGGLRPCGSPDVALGTGGASTASGVPPMPPSDRSSKRSASGNGRVDGLLDSSRENGTMDAPRSARGDSRRERRSKELQSAVNFRSSSGGSSGSRTADRAYAAAASPEMDTLDGLALTLSDFPSSMRAQQEAEKREDQQINRLESADSARKSLNDAARKRSRETKGEVRPVASPTPATTAASPVSPPSELSSSFSGSWPSGPAPGAGNKSPAVSDSSPEMPKSSRRHRTGGDEAPHTSRLGEGGSRLKQGGAAMLSARGPRSEENPVGPLGVAEHSKSTPRRMISPNPEVAGPSPPSPRTLERESREKELHGLLSATLPGPKPSPAANRTLQAANPEAKPMISSIGKPRGRVKPKSLSQSAFEFKPISRSSSEGSMASPLNKPKGSHHDDHGRGQSTTSSIHSSRPSLTTCYVNFDKFDLQIENGRAPTQLMSWDQLLALVADKDWSVRQAIEWYGWPTPTKFQAVAIPCIIQACRNVGDAKSYTLLQAAEGLGKTSAVALGLLASVRREVNSLQFIIVGIEGIEEMEKYINALGCLTEIKVAFYRGAESEDVQADIEAAQGAHVIVGHPSHVCTVLKEAQDKLSLNTFEVLFMDDASTLISEGHVQKVCEINQLVSLFAQKPLRYVVVSSFIEREAKPALRALKSSLMSKKNMFDLSHQVGRIRKCVKHYSLRGDPENWVNSLMRLRSMIYIPRAVIFCDSEARFQELKKKFTKGVRCEDGKELSIAIMDSKEQTASQRRGSLTSFCKEQQDFLLTRSEPNIFQASLPRVFWIIHFGVEPSNLSWYGCRLLCLDSQLRQKAGKGPQHDGVSILFMANEKKEREKDKDKEKDTIPKLEKMFGIKFESLPFGDI